MQKVSKQWFAYFASKSHYLSNTSVEKAPNHAIMVNAYKKPTFVIVLNTAQTTLMKVIVLTIAQTHNTKIFIINAEMEDALLFQDYVTLFLTVNI